MPTPIVTGLVAPIDPFKPMGFVGNEIKVATAKADAKKVTSGRGKTLFPDEHLGELVDVCLMCRFAHNKGSCADFCWLGRLCRGKQWDWPS